MNVLSQEHLCELVKHRSPHSVSLFMPTHRTGRERQQDEIRLKNLVAQARQMLIEKGATAADADELLEPVAELRRDDAYWRHRSDGLACFRAEEVFRAYRVPIRLEEHLLVNSRFHVRPLLPLLRSDARVCVLALTQDSAKLYEATRYSIRQIELPNLPPPDPGGDEQPLQLHSHRAGPGGRGDAEAIFHGQGGAADRAKKDALRFFQLVNREVTRLLQGQKAPLVLACVGYVAALYESANSYPHLIQGKVPGSPDRWSDDELRDHAWKIAESHFRRRQQQAWEQFQEASGAGRAADELPSVVLAADEGRVDTLFLVRGQQRWGQVDPQRRAVELADEEQQGEELLDYAAARTLSNGGEVILLDDLPDLSSPAAATLRY